MQIGKLCKSEDPAIAEAATSVVSAWKEAVKREAGAGDLRRGSSGISDPQLSVSLRRGSLASQDSVLAGQKEEANGATPRSANGATPKSRGQVRNPFCRAQPIVRVADCRRQDQRSVVSPSCHGSHTAWVPHYLHSNVGMVRSLV